jgi:hypothetical protein
MFGSHSHPFHRVPAVLPSSVGRAYVFSKTGAGWKQAAELKGSDTVGDYFGLSVAISGATAVVGAPPHAGEAARAYVFTKTEIPR